MRRILLLNLVLLIYALIGCGSTGLYITVTRPAEVNLKNYDKIAIEKIEAPGLIDDVIDGVIGYVFSKVFGRSRTERETYPGGGRSFTYELREALSQSGRFEVLDYDNLKMVLSQTDGGNEEKVRKPLGNVALISGTISVYNYSEDLTHKDREKKIKRRVKSIPREHTTVKELQR